VYSSSSPFVDYSRLDRFKTQLLIVTMSACLTVPPDSAWTVWPVSRKSSIYIRDCYPKIYGLCREAWDAACEPACELVILQGTPGVGKSLFLDYALSKLLSDNKIVMLLSGPRETVFIYKNYVEPPEEHEIKQARTNKLAAGVDYVLYDPQEDPTATQYLDMTFFCGKKFLIAISPDPDNCSKIIKDAEQNAEVYMGPTDMDESEAMRKACYANNLSAIELQRRFQQIGGIPRMLFRGKSPLSIGKHDDSVLHAFSVRQDFALNDLAENPRRIDSGSVASSFKSLWALYHLVPDELFTSYSIEICCENGLKLLRQRLLEMDLPKLWDLYKNTAEKDGTLRGIRFEAYAHKKILVDGIPGLSAIKLNANSISKSISTSITVQVPPAPMKFPLMNNNVGNLATYRAQVLQMGGGYMLPDLPNYPVLDSAFVSKTNDCFIFQIKAGKSKSMSDMVGTVCSALGPIFVVVAPGENIVTQKLAGFPAAMSQYVLILREEIPL
jgi:hypothetical protein